MYSFQVWNFPSFFSPQEQGMGVPSGRDGGQVAVVLNFCQRFSGPIGVGGREGWGKGRGWGGGAYSPRPWGSRASLLQFAVSLDAPQCPGVLAGDLGYATLRPGSEGHIHRHHVRPCAGLPRLSGSPELSPAPPSMLLAGHLLIPVHLLRDCPSRSVPWGAPQLPLLGRAPGLARAPIALGLSAHQHPSAIYTACLYFLRSHHLPWSPFEGHLLPGMLGRRDSCPQ